VAGRDRAGGRPDPGLRHLVGAGPSQVGVDGATRARDVSRPTEQDEAEAERTLVLRKARPQAQPGGGAGRGGSTPVRS